MSGVYSHYINWSFVPLELPLVKHNSVVKKSSLPSRMAHLVSFGFALLTLMSLLVCNIEANVQYSNYESLFMAQLRMNYGQGRLRPADCAPRCSYRCSATSHRKPCMFFCKKCCAKCLCVPPGTYGHKEVCPCYNNWRTQQGGPKCP